MSSLREKRDTCGRTAIRGLLLGAVAASALLALSGTALAGPDELKGGSVQLQLQNGRGLKFSPRALNLAITTGAVDPTNGAGTIDLSGAFKAKKGKSKTRVKLTGLTLGANGGQGSLAAKIGKKELARFATVSGGTVTRDGWGARIQGITATLTKKGSKALTGKSSKKGKAAAAKGGQRLGTVSVTTVPKTVEVVPGSGTMELVTSLASGSLGSKLASHCIDAITPLLVEPGVAAIPPATFDLVSATFTFPVSGGSVAPDFSDGRLITAGGQAVTKNNGPLTPNLGGPPCSTAPPPVGTQVLNTEFEAEFNLNALAANATLPNGPIGLSGLGPIDFSTGSRSVDPATGKVTVTDATVTLDGLTAFVLNQVFPNQSGDPANDFSGGDLVGTLSMTATLR